KQIAVATGEPAAHVWDLASGERVVSVHGISSGYFANSYFTLAYSRDGNRLITAGAQLQGGGAHRGGKRRTLGGELVQTVSIDLSSDGRRLVSCGSGLEGSDSFTVWNAVTWEAIYTFKGRVRSQPKSVAFSPDGQHLAGCFWDGTVKVWDGRRLDR